MPLSKAEAMKKLKIGTFDPSIFDLIFDENIDIAACLANNEFNFETLEFNDENGRKFLMKNVKNMVHIKCIA